MNCPKPHCGGHGDAGDFVTEADHMHTHAGGHFGKHNPLIGLVALGAWGAKLAFSTTYKCRSCGHVWRKWG